MTVTPGEESAGLVLLSSARGAGEQRGRLAKVQSALALAGGGFVLLNQVKGRIDSERERRAYRVSLPQSDEIYPTVQHWLLDELPGVKQKSLQVFTRSGRERGVRQFWRAYDREGAESVQLDGHRVRVSLETADDEVDGEQTLSTRSLVRPRLLVFRAATVEGQRAVLRKLQELSAEHERACQDDGTMFYTATKWGSWRRRSELMKRPVESVVLKPGQRDRLVDDVGHFLEQEEWYLKLGLPWHRGYLLHGPPGCGKTSVAQAIATEHGLSLYYVTLSSVEGDGDLTELVAEVGPRSVLLLEDVDVLHAATKRDDDTGGITLSGLLNVLDGVATPHGLITVMTTNHLERLDEALQRRGRADVVESVEPLSREQLADLLRYLLPDGAQVGSLEHWHLRLEITPAEVVEVFKATYDQDPIAVIEVIHELVTVPGQESVDVIGSPHG